MVGSFMTLTGRSGAVDHILEIPFGDTDQYTFGQLGLDIMPEKRSAHIPDSIVALRCGRSTLDDSANS
jgi:hypothetical protein